MPITIDDILREDLVIDYSSGAGPSIKSIQKGYRASSNAGSETITISGVNPVKCVVILSGGLGGQASTASVRGHVSFFTISSTLLTVTGTNYYTGSGGTYAGVPFGWQVIEYS